MYIIHQSLFVFLWYIFIIFRQIEGKVVEISRLQEIFTEKVLQQVRISYLTLSLKHFELCKKIHGTMQGRIISDDGAKYELIEWGSREQLPKEFE